VRTDPERVDAYLAGLPDGPRAVLERLRLIVRGAAPDAVEGISYNMPAFYVGRHFLVSYAAFKSHMSLFPASAGVEDQLGDQLRDNLAGRGTIRFTVDAPLSDEVIREIIRIRLAEVAAEAGQSS
jgi:uncharacterized protein YdhG (YjbR/CyaY superfamily)